MFFFFSSAAERNPDDEWAVRAHDCSVKQRVLVSGEIRVNKISKRFCVGVRQRALGASGASKSFTIDCATLNQCVSACVCMCFFF